MNLSTFWQGVSTTRERFGWRAAAMHLCHYAVNHFVFFDRLEIIELDRRALRQIDPAQTTRFGARPATRDELLAMHADPQWEIGEDKLQSFDRGDTCVLSLVDGEVAGYTWVHTQGRPHLIPGLALRIPAHHLYNYAGFTLPKFRGVGLQSVRHQSVLHQAAWTERRALLGYVRHVNYPSKRGQAKSGYRKIGSIWLIGSHQRFMTWCSPALRKHGITSDGSHVAANTLSPMDANAGRA